MKAFCRFAIIPSLYWPSYSVLSPFIVPPVVSIFTFLFLKSAKSALRCAVKLSWSQWPSSFCLSGFIFFAIPLRLLARIYLVTVTKQFLSLLLSRLEWVTLNLSDFFFASGGQPFVEIEALFTWALLILSFLPDCVFSIKSFFLNYFYWQDFAPCVNFQSNRQHNLDFGKCSVWGKQGRENWKPALRFDRTAPNLFEAFYLNCLFGGERDIFANGKKVHLHLVFLKSLNRSLFDSNEDF